MPHIELDDGAKLFYEIHGEGGEPLVFLNGLMMATRSWVDHIPLLGNHVQLILVDFRDQGQSSRRDGPYDMSHHAADLLQFFDAIGLERAHVMGLSYGGQVALLFAQHNLERLQSLILANVPHRTTDYLAAVGKAWEQTAELDDGERFFQIAIPYVYSAHFYEREQEWLQSREKLFGKVLTREWFQALIRLSRAAKAFDFSPEQLEHLTVPTLLLGADEDFVAPLRDMDILFENLPNREMLVFHKAGHGAFLERIDEFATALLGFVQKHGGAPGCRPSKVV